MATTFIGIDVGGTKIAAAAVDVSTGAVAGRTVIAAEAQAPPDKVIEQMARLVETVCRNAGLPPDHVAGLGVGVPGAIDLEQGRTVFLPNFRDGWRDVPVAASLERLTGYPAWLINDGSAFTLAEATLGGARRADNCGVYSGYRYWRRYCHQRQTSSGRGRHSRRIGAPDD